MRAEGYRVRPLLAALLILAGCGDPVATSPPSASPASAAPRPSATVVEASPSGSPAPSPSAAGLGEPVRIDLAGSGPIGMAIDGSIGWVCGTESGELIGVDLAAAAVTDRITVGPGGDHVVVLDDGSMAVSRIGMDAGQNLVFISAGAHDVRGLSTRPLGGLAPGEDGTLWALEKTGPIRHVDPAKGVVLATIDGTLATDQHIEIVSGAGARWVSGDRTPIRRIAADGTVAAEIETGGGIPLDVDGGLIWGARADELWAIDPATNQVSRHIPLLGIDEILALDIDGSDAWIAARRPGRVGVVVRLALPTGAVVGQAAVELPAAVELTAERAWVTDNARGELLGFAR